MLSLFRTYKYYYSLAFGCVLAGLIALLCLDKGELVLMLNIQHTPVLDEVFKWITKGGEVLGACVILVLLALLRAKRAILILVASIIISLAVSQFLKHVVFQNEGRPSSVYIDLLPIEGVTHHKNNSFPSGHTSAAFTFFTVLAIGVRSKPVQIAAPFLASLVGLSRVYLGQHYLNDIVAGAVLGLLGTSIAILLLDRYIPVKDKNALV